MKYCLKYSNICVKLSQADEIRIKYIEDKGLVAFLEKFNSKRVNLAVNPMSFPDSEVNKLIAIKKTFPNYNFAVALAEKHEALMVKLKAAGIAFYVDRPCLDWEEFNWLINIGVSDVNISGPLGFELSKVKRVLNSLDRNVQVRATVNKVQNISAYTNPLIGFYIRPNDIDLYEPYIDVIEFEGLEYQDTFFDIYAKHKMFIGNLNQCIFGFHEQVDNKGLVSLFGERRIDCGRQCLIGGRCRRCYTLADLAKPMGERARDHIMEILRKEQEKMKDEE